LLERSCAALYHDTSKELGASANVIYGFIIPFSKYILNTMSDRYMHLLQVRLTRQVITSELGINCDLKDTSNCNTGWKKEIHI